MNPKDILEIIPHLLMYFIPGYIVLRIKKNNRQEKKHDDKETFIWSIIYSFIISIISFIGIKLFGFLGKEIEHRSILDMGEVNEVYVLFNFFIAWIFGYIMSRYSDLKLYKSFRKFLKINHEPYSSLWNYAMRNPNGAWVRVYLDEYDIGYVGSLISYTCDPDSELREVLLSKYTSFKISDFEAIDDYSTDEDALILLNSVDIKRIEILKEKVRSDYINYNQELNKIFKNENIWSNKCKDINDSEIDNLVTLIEEMDRITLERILLILKDYEPDKFENMNIYLSIITIIIAISTFIATIDNELGLPASIIYLFVIITLGIFYTIKTKKNKRKINKIRCIEIAIKGILEKSMNSDKYKIECVSIH